MARPRHRAEDGGKPHRLLLGTPNELVEWRYGTASDARDRIKTYLTEIENFAARYNPALREEVVMTRNEILNAEFRTTTAEHARSWQFTDESTGLTWVVKLWKEK